MSKFVEPAITYLNQGRTSLCHNISLFSKLEKIAKKTYIVEQRN
jgi:hypothetical protein